MRTIMFLMAVIVCWGMVFAWHTQHPDAVYLIPDLNENKVKEDIETVLSANAPDGFWGIKSAVAVRSVTEQKRFCVWYVKPYESEFVWQELEKERRLKCD